MLLTITIANLKLMHKVDIMTTKVNLKIKLKCLDLILELDSETNI